MLFNQNDRKLFSAIAAPFNNRLQRTALRAAAEPESWAFRGFDLKKV
jgi:hypothetical protein